MKLTLHHINLSTSDVEQMDNFYQHILGLDDKVEGLPTLEKNKGYAGDVAFVSDDCHPDASRPERYSCRL